MTAPQRPHHPRPAPAVARLLAAGMLLCAAATAAAQGGTISPSLCGSLAQPFGPYDYRDEADRKFLKVVENNHFTPQIESLIRGKTGTLGQDLDFTLQKFPNHHRALVAVVRLGERMKSPQPDKLGYPVECYFERALRFRPDDRVVRMLYADFLAKNGRKTTALDQLAVVAAEAGDNALTHHNLGLLYLALDRPDEALVHAHRAQALGLARAELKDALQAKGRWREPEAAATAATAASAASAPASAASAP